MDSRRKVGYILIIISGEIGRDMSREVRDKLIQYDKVVEVNHLFGLYDLIVKVESERCEEIGEFAVNVVRNMEGVGGTKTLVGSMYE